MRVIQVTLTAAIMATLLLFLPTTAGENIYKAAGKSVFQKVPKLFPSGSELKEIVKNKFSSLTFEPVAKLSDKICSLAIISENTQPVAPVDINSINYVLLTEFENISFPITDAAGLWQHPKFNPNNDVAIFITGFRSAIDHKNRAVDGVWDAYRYRGNINFIIIDTAEYMRQMYTWSAFHTQSLGEGLGRGLSELSAMYPISKIHLIGHSLGAHIAGVAGDTFKNLTNQLLPRITGLDPAYLCFREGEVLHRLTREDAAFVDVIHTNSNVLGIKDSIGHADFFPNGKVSLQPGCYSPKCSHRRAWLLYAQSVYPQHEHDLMAFNCNGMSSLRTNTCMQTPVPMGFLTPSTARGNFYLRTRSHSPF